MPPLLSELVGHHHAQYYYPHHYHHLDYYDTFYNRRGFPMDI